MRRSKFTDAQIVAIMREAEPGMAVAELLRTHGISRPTLYRWEQKFGGAGVPELQRLKALAHENAKRKRMYADRAMLADRVLSRTGRCGRADAGRHGCITTALQAIVAQHGRWGFWKCFDRLRALGHAWNH